MTIWGFNRKEDAERSIEIARQTPRGQVRLPPEGATSQGFWFQSRLAKTDGSGVSARSGTTAGSGTVTLQYLSGTTITDGSETVTVYNWTDDAAAATTYVWVQQDTLGTWWITGEDC